MTFTPAQLAQLAAAGIPPEEAARQLALLAAPPPAARLVRPCTVGDGILAQPSEAHQAELVATFAAARDAGRVRRFVPASGAASRMFATLAAWSAWAGTPTAAASEMRRRAIAGDPAAGDGVRFAAELPRFAFASELAATLAAGGQSLETLRTRGDVGALLHVLLDAAGLGYSERPKALIPFHHTPDGPRTAAAEQLAEAARLVRDAAGVCRVAFTVSPSAQEAVAAHLDAAATELATIHGARFELALSTQSPATDTLALGDDGKPFVTATGELLLRPGGHGALLHNLAELARGGAQVVLVKNIDNIQPARAHAHTSHWSAVLAGHLLRLRTTVDALLDRLTAGDDTAADEAAAWFPREFTFVVPAGWAALPAAERRAAWIDRLDRPLRVAGVVKNSGEPGGGPFWVEREGEQSGQIVERAEVSPEPAQQAVFASSTHFNPVDLALAVCDRHGQPYDLHRFVEPRAVFIAAKTHQGRPLRALERPGLWNGAMAGWNTAFVEVPADTFAPVKTVFDLLRREHQP